ncbi:unnamed protein product, partial [Ectocarpus fasciculatus]
MRLPTHVSGPPLIQRRSLIQRRRGSIWRRRGRKRHEEEDGDDGDSADPSSLPQSDEGDEEQSACAAGSRCRKPGNTKAAVVKTRCCGQWAHMGCASMCAYCNEGGGSAAPARSQDSASAPVPATSTDAVGHSSLHQADDGVARNYNLSRDNSGHLSRAQCPTPSHDGGGMTMGGGQQHPVAAQQGVRTHGSPYSGQPPGPDASGHLHNDGGMAGGGGQRSTAVQHGAVMYAAPGPEAAAGHPSSRIYTPAAPRAHQDSPSNGFQYDPPGRGRSTDNGQTAAQLLSIQAHQKRSTGEDRRARDDYQAQHRMAGRAGGPEPGDSFQQPSDGTNATRVNPARGYEGGDGGYNSSEGVQVEKVVAAPYTPDAASGPDEQRRVGGASGAAPFKEVANPYLKDTRASGSNPSRLDPSPGSRALDCDESMVWRHATSLRNYTFLSSSTPNDGGLAVVLQNQIRSALRCTNIVSREYLLKPWPAQNDRPDFG